MPHHPGLAGADLPQDAGRILRADGRGVQRGWTGVARIVRHMSSMWFPIWKVLSTFRSVKYFLSGLIGTEAGMAARRAR
ncbi:hypothetical protein Sru01_52470 [Sphaerisporangium rufum]|uniref:Uncharacterized protein n=1 Tax=Sphaerisporangium rufum TaxID=1381558 RepID=A0A919V7D3_9ACTN|nr:hypothetical protein Sru01_52470 [Sphaerisporangium rufum]